jgi:hypothetical protein
MKKLGEPQMEYAEQVEKNNWAFMEMLKKVRPDIWLITDLLDKTEVNYLLLVKALRHIDNIARGSRYGNVTLEIQDGICTFVRGAESDRLNEPVILPKKELGA